MAFLSESAIWEAGIRQLETNDPVQGGPGGIDNIGPGQLANRTVYLKDQIDSFRLADTALYKSASATLTVNEFRGGFVSVDATGQGTVVITLPAVSSLVKGDRVLINATTGSDYNGFVTIQRNGSNNLYFHGDLIASMNMKRGDMAIFEVFTGGSIACVAYYRHKRPMFEASYSKVANATIAATEVNAVINVTYGGSGNITLPTADSNHEGDHILIKNMSTNAGEMFTILPAAAQTLETDWGYGSSVSVPLWYRESVLLICRSSQWKVLMYSHGAKRDTIAFSEAFPTIVTEDPPTAIDPSHCGKCLLLNYTDPDPLVVYLPDSAFIGDKIAFRRVPGGGGGTMAFKDGDNNVLKAAFADGDYAEFTYGVNFIYDWGLTAFIPA